MKNILYKTGFVVVFITAMLVSCNQDDAFSLDGYPDSVINDDPPGAPPRGITENWNDHSAELNRKYFDSYIAIYYGDEVDREMTWPYAYLSDSWQHILSKYGQFGNESARLYAAIHQDLDSDPYFSTYFNEETSFRSLIDFSVEGIEMSPTNLDVPTSLLSEIVENSSYETLGSPAHAVWQDKFSEIFRYDMYTSLELTDDASRIYDTSINSASTFPSPDTYWFRDWFYPLYETYNGTVVFNNFFKVLSQYYKKSGEAYDGDMNMGEFVHFFSGATGDDLQPMAENAFGWTDEWEQELLQARTDYPNLNYPFDPTSKLVDLTTDATLTVSKDNGDGPDGGEGSLKLVDNDIYTKFLVGGLPSDFELWLQQELSSQQVVNRYTLTSGNDAPERDPIDWELQASNDGSTWTTLDTRSGESFSNRNQTREFVVENEDSYLYYRLFITKNGGSDAVQISEWRLLSLEMIDPSAPIDVTINATLNVSNENANGAEGAEGSLKLIDDNANTKYLASYSSDFWLQQELTRERTVTQYALTSGNDAPDRDPVDWELLGSMDGNTWDVLDSRNGEAFSERNQTRTFMVSNTTPYLFYRINITANNGSDALQLSEWRLFE
ncbi:discoidin domain-containing protein [Galbibacter sp. PAP.153]|uniref:discoidin domain-containing protein n=1 Tax=Galbibacter sp. PAP.153 TaxID=3104623 RepID=UPI00300AC4FF